MKVYRFIEAAEVMRKGGLYFFPAPRRYSSWKSRSHINKSLTEAYSALCRFRIKHPDSKRSNKARQRAKDLRAARNERGDM